MNAHGAPLVNDPWSYLWGLGYHRLIPVIPPGVEVSPRSYIHRSVGTSKDKRGKAPGLRGDDGQWFGFREWTTHRATEADIECWRDMGASIGIATGDETVGLDIDAYDPALADRIRDCVDRMLGSAPRRVGQAPKALHVFRPIDEIPYMLLPFGERIDGEYTDRIELLSFGKQFVAHGVHARTGRTYAWTNRLPPIGELPTVTHTQLKALFAELRTFLPNVGEVVELGAQVVVDQAALRAQSVEAVRAAVTAARNSSTFFPTRESYVNFGYLIKASLPDDSEAAFTIFSDWCDSWVEGENDPETVAADWGRMKPPYKAGASKLFEVAEHASGGVFSASSAWAARWMDQPESDSAVVEPRKIGPTPYSWPSAIPPRQSLYGGHYIRRWISSTIAPSKVGKSSLALAEALAMASGKPLLGVAPAGQFRVWWWNGEDPRDELDRRAAAAIQHYGLTREDLGDRLMLDSGRDLEILLARQGERGAVLNDEGLKLLQRWILESRIDASIFDPFISLHRVSENDNNAIDLTTKALNRVAGETNSAIEIPHHTRKLYGGGATVEDGRGASALLATTRSTRALAKMTKEEAARLGVPANVRIRLLRFTDAGNNVFLPDAALEDRWMELKSVNLGNGVGEDEMDRIMNGDSVGVMTACDLVALLAGGASELDQARETAALEAIRKHEYRRDSRSDAWVGIPISIALGLDRETREGLNQVKNVIKEWIKAGKLVEENRLNKARQLKTFVSARAIDNLAWLD